MNDNILTTIKAGVTLVATTVSAWLGNLAIPVIILVGLNICDYITGLVAAPYRGEMRNSNKGFRGIAKKICMWLLVGIGAVIDWVILFAGEAVGIEMTFKFAIAAAVAIWLICNEIISLLENISDIGVTLPAFLGKIVAWIKKQTEDKIEVPADDEKEDK